MFVGFLKEKGSIDHASATLSLSCQLMLGRAMRQPFLETCSVLAVLVERKKQRNMYIILHYNLYIWVI